jgi:uncharacterized membrane protein
MQTVGVFERPEVVDCVAEEMRRANLQPGDLSVVIREATEERKPEVEMHRGAKSATVKGTVIGGVAGLAVGAATIMVPGVGPLLAAGPLSGALSAALAVLSGAAAGATVGATAGAVADIGVPESEVREYSAALRRGNGMLGLDHDGTHDIEGMFRRCGCRTIRSFS